MNLLHPFGMDYEARVRSGGPERRRRMAISNYRFFATVAFILIVAGDFCSDSGLYRGFGSDLFGPASVLVWLAIIVAGIARLGRRRGLH